MIPDKLIVRNFGIFEKFVLNFQAGVGFIGGANGSGKTTLTRDALLFAVTGQTPETVSSKSELVRWKGDGTGETEFWCHQDGVQYKLVRRLHTNYNRLDWTDAQGRTGSLQKASEIQTLIQDLVGQDFAFLKQARFIRQGHLTDIIDATHAERMDCLQALTGVSRFESYRSLVQTEGIAKLPVFPDTSVDKEAAQTAQQELQVTLAGITKELSDLQQAKQKMEAYRAQAEDLNGLPTADVVQKQGAEIQRQIQVQQTLLAGLQTEDAPPKVAMAQQELDDLFRWQQTEAEREEAELAELAERGVGKEPQQPAIVRTHIAELQAQAQELQAQDQVLAVESRLASEDVCPTCGAVDEHWSVKKCSLEDVQERLRQNEFASQDVHAHLAQLCEAWAGYDQNLAKHTARVDAAHQRLKAAVSMLQGLQDAGFDPEVSAQKKKQQRAYLDWLDANASLQTERATCTAELERLNASLKSCAEQRTVDHASQKWAAEWFAYQETLPEQFHEIELRQVAAQTALQARERELARIQETEEKAAKVGALRKRLESVRDILHRDRFPRRVLANRTAGINKVLQEYLSLLGVRFSARLSEDGDFMFVSEETSSERPAQRLSNGQKIKLALAFWPAVSHSIQSQFPVLVIDEPSNHLDAEAKDILVDMVTRLDAVARGGQFILMMDHYGPLQQAASWTVMLDESTGK